VDGSQEGLNPETLGGCRLKPVLVSQRVDVLAERGERRDGLDQQLVAFLAACGLLTIPVPNHPWAVERLFAALPSTAGVVLSGGGDLGAYGGNAPERDETERRLVRECLTRTLPVLGICRGMQCLVHEDGGTLTRIDGHVAVHHAVDGRVGRHVNSYHRWAVTSCGERWEVLGQAQDGSIEFARRRDAPIVGIMWHPEREKTFAAEDLRLVKETFDSLR
jgi:gamma-glutamyl-gamma-aminobutyrate hydrolase PuuD